jgi:uncharacterized protein YciI
MTAGARAAEALRVQQQRVARVLGALPDGGWDVRLDDAARARLVGTGHFPEYAAELDWCPQQVAGHLRDSARVFTSRLQRMLAGELRPLGAFDPVDVDRAAGYLATPRALLLADLFDAQERLRVTVNGLADGDLIRSAVRADGSALTVATVLDFLPGHQADHADQLEMLLHASPPSHSTGGPVFLLLPRYTAPLERIDELLPEHAAWLDRHYTAGRFLASGRQVPRRGGVVLAALPDRADAEAVTAEDPFVRAGAAEYEIVEFSPTKVAPGLERLLETAR